jgi:hypothetical protein
MDDSVSPESGDEEIKELKAQSAKHKPPPKPRKHQSSFLSLVTGKRNRTYDERKGDDKPKALDYYVSAPEPKYPLMVRKPYGKEQVVSEGMIRGTLGTVPMGELKTVIYYLLDRERIQYPENFRNLDKLRERDGGKEIILNEIWKEPQEVQEDIYQLAGRIKSAHLTKAQKQKALEIKDGKLTNIKTVHPNIQAFEYQQRPRDPYQNTAKEPQVDKIVSDDTQLLMSNQGPPYDDPTVYVHYPAKPYQGMMDGDADLLVDLCGPEMDSWFSRTAHEYEYLPETGTQYMIKDKLFEKSRALCPVSENKVSLFLRKLRNGEPIDSPNQLDDYSLQQLRSVGWDDQFVDKIYGPNSKLRTDADGKTTSKTWKKSSEYEEPTQRIQDYPSLFSPTFGQ